MCLDRLQRFTSSTDDHGNDDSMTVLEELEQIDDDCDKHGIQFVKIDDAKAAADYGIDSVRFRQTYIFD